MNADGPRSGPAARVLEVDARGTRCPMPVIMAARAALGAEGGQMLRVRATDPAAASDLPAWARMRGHEIVSLEVSGQEVVATLRLTLPA